MYAFMPEPKNLASLFADGLPEGIPEELLVCDVQIDSREVSPGSLFIAVAGVNSTGEQYLPNAIENGAVAILIDSAHQTSVIDVTVPVIAVNNLKSRVASIAANFYASANAKPTLFGVTGTNGKSTITSMIAQLHTLLGERGAVVGTLGYGFGDKLISTGMTTPDVVKTHRIIAELKSAGADCIAMEVSSHGIHQRRIEEIIFDVAVISNITHDHLDYHGTFDRYAAVKKDFILSDSCRACAVNFDDEECRTLVSDIKNIGKPLLSYGIDKPSADLCASVKHLSPQGFDIELSSPWGTASLHIPFLGRFNLSNVLAVIAAGCLAGSQFDSLCALVPKLHPVDGRLQEINVSASGRQHLPRVFVDFAHTPDALERAIAALREHLGGRLWLVFGCGGDRDRAKRGTMGAIAAASADCVMVTSDNPRTDPPQMIIDEIIAGISRNNASAGARVESQVDRKNAINATIKHADREDIILIAGKGHEDYQIIGTEKFPFSDAEVAAEALQSRGALAQGGL